MELNVDRDAYQVSDDPVLSDLPIWHAFRPEVRSSDLRWNDLKLLVDRQKLLSTDYIWHPAWDSWRLAGDVPGLVSPVSSPTDARASAPLQKSIKERARREFQSYLVISLYIWAIVTVLRLHQDLLAEAYHFTLQSQGRAIVLALILGKVVLIAEALKLGDSLSSRFPALSVAIQSMLFSIAIVAFHAGEEAVAALWDGRNLISVVHEISLDTMKETGLQALIMTIALVPYFLIKEIEKQTGQRDLLLLAVGLKRRETALP